MLGIFLLYTTINCIDAADMIGRLDAHQGMNEAVKAELVEVIQEATPHCSWDVPKNPTTLGVNKWHRSLIVA